VPDFDEVLMMLLSVFPFLVADRRTEEREESLTTVRDKSKPELASLKEMVDTDLEMTSSALDTEKQARTKTIRVKEVMAFIVVDCCCCLSMVFCFLVDEFFLKTFSPIYTPAWFSKTFNKKRFFLTLYF